MSRGVVYKGHRIAAARMERRVGGLEAAVETLISDFDSRLRRLEVLAAEPFLERIKTLLESDPTFVPEFRDNMRLAELSVCAHEGLRQTANRLRAEIARRRAL
jgi:hypothetical protein